MKIRRAAITLLFIFAAWLGVQHIRAKQYQTALQEKILNARFSQVRPKGSHVSLIPAERYSFTLKPMVLTEGSTFGFADRHWVAKYTVTKITDNEVDIYYEADGADPAAVRSSSGTVKLRPK